MTHPAYRRRLRSRAAAFTATLGATVALIGPLAAQAELHDRELDGNLSNGPEAYFDTDLNVTWLRQASTSAYDWQRANLWAQQDRFGITGWRLPTLVDIRRDGCPALGASTVSFSFSGGSDCGYNSTRIDALGYQSELAQLYYVTLGNKAYYAPGTGAAAQPGWGLRNTGGFQGLQANYYWFDLPLDPAAPGEHWRFDMLEGLQYFGVDSAMGYALAVRLGDVSAVPEPGSGVMCGMGCLAMAMRYTRRRHWTGSKTA